MTNQVDESIKRVVLTGFMGSGKTTIGKLLGAELGWTFFDLDAEIENRCGLGVPSLFRDHGESYFREQEAEALAGLLDLQHVVIALGGGAPETTVVRNALQASEATAVVYLRAPFVTLRQRCADDEAQGATSRPLMADEVPAQARYESRQALYTSVATVTVDTGGLLPAAVAERVMQLLR